MTEGARNGPGIGAEGGMVAMLIWNFWPGPEGGAERQCRKQAGELVSRGRACVVLTRWARGSRRRQVDSGVEIRRFGWVSPLLSRVGRGKEGPGTGSGGRTPASGLSRCPGRLRAMVAQSLLWLEKGLFLAGVWAYMRSNHGGIGVIHVHESHWIAGYGVWLGRKFGIPVICKEATFPPVEEVKAAVPFRRLWSRERMKAHFIALTEPVREGLVAAGVPPARVTVIPNGVEVPGSTAAVAENRDVLLIGNFSQGRLKAFDVLFPAWKAVTEELGAGRLRALGGGDRSEWEAFVREAGIENRVTFCGFTRDIESHALRSAVFVLPSRTEGMSNALLEAMSFGLPVVVSDIPSNVSVITDGVEGLVVPVGDPDRLASAIARLLRDPDLREAMGSKGRMAVEELYSLEAVTGRLLDLYARLAVESGEPGPGAA